MNIIGRKQYCITSDYNTCQHRKSMIGIKLVLYPSNLMMLFTTHSQMERKHGLTMELCWVLFISVYMYFLISIHEKHLVVSGQRCDKEDKIE